MSRIYKLKGTVKHYDWGGTAFIPAILNKENKTARPFAEYWLGTHPHDDCKIELENGSTKLLREFLTEHHFKQLPYLLKILDVKNMLSIQVHPSKEAAEKEFARENKEGISLHASNRNYKDDNHKPELMVALSDFWLIHGFKSASGLRTTLKTVTELNCLLPVFEQSGYNGLYRHVMEMPHEEVNKILQPLIDRIVPLYSHDKLNKAQESFWAARAAITFDRPGKIDRGIFSIYFFNLLQLKKGEGIYQPAGVPHAYLEGQNVEIMASSDNVLRGGLTTKHVDVKELLKHVKCEATTIEIIKGESNGNESAYHTPAPDFRLSSIKLLKGQNFSFSATNMEILLAVNGAVQLKGANQTIILQEGDPAAICFPGGSTNIIANSDSRIFRASIP